MDVNNNLFRFLPTPTVFNRNGKLTLNRKAEELVGYSNAEIGTLERWVELLFPEFSKSLLEAYDQSRASGFSKGYSFVIVSKSGERKLIEFTGALIDDCELWTLNDLTQKTLVEQRFLTLFEHSADALFLVNDSGIVDCNLAAVKVLNASSRADLIGKAASSFSPEFQVCGTDSMTKNAMMTEFAQRNGSHRFEWTHRKITGETFPAEVTLNYIESVGQKMLLVTWHDLSEDKRTAQFIRKITDTIPSMLCVYSLVEQRNIFVNDACLELIGYSPQEVMSQSMLQLVHPDDLDGLVDSLTCMSSLRDNQYAERQYRLRHKDGKYIHLFVRSSIFERDENGVPTKIIGIASDVTQNVLTQEALDVERSKSFHAAKMATLGEMASGIAHEINNPLTIILGKSSQLKKQLMTDTAKLEDSVAALDRINLTVDRIAKIVRGLRSFARDGERDPFQEVSARGLIEETLEFCQARLKHNGVEVRVPSWKEDFQIFCQPTQIQQVLLNLLNNAFDAIQNLPEKWVEIQLEVKASWVELAVVDSGLGISEEIRSKIMQPFYTTKEIGTGTGLGLSISKGIVNAHQGEFEVDSSCKNTRFVMRLPFRTMQDVA